MWGMVVGVSARCLPPCLSIPVAPDVPPAVATHTGWWDRGALTRVGPASAEVQARERAAGAGVQGRGAGEVELVQGHGAVEYVLWGQGRGVNMGVFGPLCPCAPQGFPRDAVLALKMQRGNRGTSRGAFRRHISRKKEGEGHLQGVREPRHPEEREVLRVLLWTADPAVCNERNLTGFGCWHVFLSLGPGLHAPAETQ